LIATFPAVQLEDHLGDIIRKARMMSNVSAAAAARAAGVSESELKALESTGRTEGRPDYSKLAEAIGLDAGKLVGIAADWLPTAADLGRWRELRCLTTTDGEMAVNSYLAWDEATLEAALFDTGWDAAPVFAEIDKHGLQLKHLFITHSHEDHVAALGAVRERFPKVRLHSGSPAAPLEQRNRPNDFIHLGSLRISHRATPGHAEDGTTYLIGSWPENAPAVAIVGDAIFAGSMGRGNPSWELARQKVREQILSLPEKTLICPGHGPLTSVGQEKENNPFF
jgi:glyoxylase-like metal-dependent hydrolase (beta-lactamase superfamily II)